MLRRFAIMLTLLLTLPAFANATWYVTASASRSAGDTTSRVSPAGSTAMAGFSGFKNISTIAGTGFQVNRVTIDGISQSLSSSNFYTVSETAGVDKTYRTVVAYFGPTTVAGASIAVTKPANASYRVTSPINATLTNIPVGSNRTVTVIPYSGYAVTVAASDIVPNGACTTAASSQFLGAVDVICNNIQGGITIGGSSAVSQVVTANAGPDRNLAGTGAAYATTLYGSATYQTGTPSFSWTVTNSPAGSTPVLGAVSGHPEATSFYGDKPGNYVLQLSVTAAGVTGTDTVTVNLADPTTTVANFCAGCHSTRNPLVITDYNSAGAVHKANGVTCQTCHDPSNTGHYTLNGTTNPPQCSTCHDVLSSNPNLATADCSTCHNSTDVHGLQATTNNNCLDCHSVAIQHQGAAGNFVNDNNGVRNIANEFTKRSHHITGVSPNAAHCAACHLEGKIVGGVLVVDKTVHMADAQVHLRNADTDADMPWNPESPDFTTLDNFCMSCHDSDGAISTGSQAIQTYINANGIAVSANAASALNPFGDTISNGYDKMLRGRVVDAAGQFNPANPSHHAVKQAKYSGRTRVAGSRQITSAATFANNSGATYPGVRETIYEADRFVDSYRTLSGVNGDKTLGDDSTLHCADCHTVGQFAARGTVAFQNLSAAFGGGITNFYKTAIGAHGSNNEYLLRNSIGTDQLHRGADYSAAPAVLANGIANLPVLGDGTVAGGSPAFGSTISVSEVPTAQPFLVCYNCHVYSEYGSVYFSNVAQGGRDGGHAEEHSRGSFCNGPYNTSGSGRATTWTAIYGAYSTTTTNVGKFMGVANFNFGRLQPGIATNLYDGTSATAATYKNQGGADDDTVLTVGAGYNRLVLTVAYGGRNPGDFAIVGDPKRNTATLYVYNGMNGNGNGGANIYQIQCMNCHNSGPANGFGGIHGAKVQTYTDANNVSQKAYRFLPGLGNVAFVPGVAYTGADDRNWEYKSLAGTNGGCYTLGTTSGAAATTTASGGTITAGPKGPDANNSYLFGSWGSCTDHSATTSGTGTNYKPVKEFTRPVTY